ncbi:coniferyl-alcohol dehydrogenase [Rhodococcus sp. NPDC003322]
MTRIDGLWRYDDRRVVVTGCASGIGAELALELAGLGAEVIGLDVREPTTPLGEFVPVDLSDADSIDGAVAAVGSRVDVLFNVAGVSSGIGDPLRVVTINFLGLRQLTEALVPRMPSGSAIVSVSSLAGSRYLDNRPEVLGLLDTATMKDGISWCREHPEALADGGYRLSKEAIILYTMSRAGGLGARGIRVNCTGPGVTETPILDQLRTAYGQGFLDGVTTPLGRVSDPIEQAAALLFLGSRAASYVTGQVLWVDGGTVGSRVAGDPAYQ